MQYKFNNSSLLNILKNKLKGESLKDNKSTYLGINIDGYISQENITERRIL